MEHLDHTLLTLREVIAKTSLSKPTIYKRVDEGTFPRQVQIGRNRVAWLQREIHAWIEAQARTRNA